MRGSIFFTLILSSLMLGADTLCAMDFGPAENALGSYRTVRYENIYTKVPTTGKLVSIRITDDGKTYYICREKSGYAIYHVEIRLPEAVQERIQLELKKKARNWTHMNPDELVVTKEIVERELRKQFAKEIEAVWVRNEVVIEPPR